MMPNSRTQSVSIVGGSVSPYANFDSQLLAMGSSAYPALELRLTKASPHPSHCQLAELVTQSGPIRLLNMLSCKVHPFSRWLAFMSIQQRDGSMKL